MDLGDPAWATHWSVARFAPICESPPWPQEYGSDQEPGSSLWCASLANAFASRFVADLVLLDYGCGGARFANFLSRRLTRFVYFGVEPRSAVPSARGVGARTNIELCQQHFGHDARVRFGYIGTELETEAIARAQVIVAGSIFTHLAFEEVELVCSKFSRAVHGGAEFVFSIFFGESYELSGESACHGVAGCWSSVQYTPEMIGAVAQRLGLRVEHRERFGSSSGAHQILAMIR